MKKSILLFMLQCISFIAVAQMAVNDSVGCQTLDNIKFKGGLDTVEFTALYSSNISGDQDPRLAALSDKKQILADEYQDKNQENTYVEFMLPNCDKRFMGILNRKIYDRTFVRTHIEDFQTEIVNLNNITTYQKILIKCIVFQDQKLKDRWGSYFLVIIELRPL